ncbi:hypothetical protein ACJMK2_009410 [Sinanodonta woodiana]|uniref:Golgi apparatus protein 1 n=1 Tax=Sinanodonta woodiana TaxID=1069815 RepID=A0ABD3VF96_SINWO
MASYVGRENLFLFIILVFGVFTFVQSTINGSELPIHDAPVVNVHDFNQSSRFENSISVQKVAEQRFRPDAVPAAQGNDIQQKSGGQPQVLILDSTECRQDVQRLCSPKLQKDNFAILDCLQDAEEESVNEVCLYFLYQYKRNLTLDMRFDSAAKQVCSQELEMHPHSQGATLECLAKHLATLSSQCKRQLLRVAELQSDDYHMDRPLYYACREDRERFCEKIPAGAGKVFECLFKHKFEQEMSKNCREKLVQRQQMIAEDVKIDKTFFIACKPDIDKYNCFFNHNDVDVRRSTVLLCLQNAMKKDLAVTPECIAEMSEMRRSLMSDYQISPEIAIRCNIEINERCLGIQSEGQTLHCLMGLANMRNNFEYSISVECKAALEDLIREADPVSNFRIDRVLAEACEPVVNTICRDIPSSDGGRVMNCLMENLDNTKFMTEDCEEKLMEIQYFVVRDFRLDPRLYKYCHKEAKELCHASDDWYNAKTYSADNSPMVLPCLYRHMKDKDQQVTRACKHEIRRTLRQRAKSVDLEPEIEDKCIFYLARYCSNATSSRIEKGAEIACLQDMFEKLDDDCRKAIGNFTEDEDEDIELDNILMRSCTPMLKRFCQSEMGRDTDASDVMSCLIEHKHDEEMDPKCAAGIEHHQLITLKDYRFSHKFKEACKESVIKHCNKMTEKSQVVSCLSEIVRNDILLENKHRISHECRKQLKVEVLRRGENIDLDPELKSACRNDVSKYCRTKHPGDAQIIECLKENEDELSKECFRVVFKREKDEAFLGDYTLFTVCKPMIKKYCQVTDRMDDIFDCLKKQKNLPEFDGKCGMFVSRRQIQENKDYRLNPSLQNSCKMDIENFCKTVIEKNKDDQLMEGEVIQCLKQRFVKKMLSKKCTDEIYEIIKEAAKDYRQDPVLAKACKMEIQMYCREELEKLETDGDDGGQIEECLKERLFDKKINQSSRCFQEVLRLSVEVKIDVNVDPILHSTCQNDINRYCGDVPAKEGRQMTCLLSIQEDHPATLNTKCLKLLQQRKALWELSAKISPPESFEEKYNQVMESPARHMQFYLMGIFMIGVVLILSVGTTCGRVLIGIKVPSHVKVPFSNI